MTEEEWLTSADPGPMLRLVQQSGGARKAAMYAFACCLRCWHLMPDERVRRAVLLMPEYADGLATQDELREACADVANAYDFEDLSMYESPAGAAAPMALAGATALIPEGYSPIIAAQTGLLASFVRKRELGDTGEATELLEQSRLVREVFGNPFRPVSVDPGWLTPDVLQIASCIYEERDFRSMPVLGDALEEAGCADQSVIAHCRETSGHVRGCWVVDLLLEK